MAFKLGDVRLDKATLIDGDPLNPSDYDLLAVQGRLRVGYPVPDGWTVLTGNMNDSLVAAVVYRGVLVDATGKAGG